MRLYLLDEEWAIIEPLLPLKKRGTKRVDDRKPTCHHMKKTLAIKGPSIDDRKKFLDSDRWDISLSILHNDMSSAADDKIYSRRCQQIPASKNICAA